MYAYLVNDSVVDILQKLVQYWS